MTPDEIREAVLEERQRQRLLFAAAHAWGIGDLSAPLPNPVKVMVLCEEAGEVARAAYDRDDAALRVELTRLAACCHAWMESL